MLAVKLGEAAGRVGKYLQTNGLELTVQLDARGLVARDYEVVGLPATFLIDPSGNIGRRIAMGELDPRAVAEWLAAFDGKDPGGDAHQEEPGSADGFPVAGGGAGTPAGAVREPDRRSRTWYAPGPQETG